MKKDAPATARNQEPILAVLKDVLPGSGTVLEIAAGTGQHAVVFAPAFPRLTWLPTDRDDDNLASIRAWRAEHPSPNLLPPLPLDVEQTVWPVENDPPDAPVCAIVATNLIHISPWSASEGLMGGAGRILPPGGVLYLYGPFKRHGKHTAPSNADFEQWLKDKDPDFGLRDVDDVSALAAAHGLSLTRTIEMPANNLSVILRKD